MMLSNQNLHFGVGESVEIVPGTPHNVTNTGHTPLKIICACSPPYAHEDTQLLSLIHIASPSC